MIDYTTGHIEKLSVHHVGNRNNGEELNLSALPVDISDDTLKDLLMKFFLHPFSAPEFYNFSFSNGDFNLNPLYNFAAQSFASSKSFHAKTVDIAKHLYDLSNHPQIKSGDLFVVYVRDISLNDETTDAIGIFKSENRQDFLKLNTEADNFTLQYEDGISIEKPDKGCLIFNLDNEQGFKVCMIDKPGKAGEAQYWKDEFLKLKPCADQYHKTHQFLSLCKDYIKEQLPAEFEVTRADQIDMLNKSVSFFKSNEQFDYKNFTREVIQEPGMIRSFGRFKEEFEQQNSLALADEFDISNAAVKKQAKNFKSILKLDKNFHVYIHGDRNLIEKGFDDEKRMNYYKIYFKDEH